MNIILSFYLVFEISFSTFVWNIKTISVTDEFQKEDCIELTINNIRSNNGLLRIGFYSSDAGFPDKPSISYSLSKDTISNGTLRLKIPVTRQGSYSVSILDDENKNGKMDYRLGIIPREGFGFTNNPGISIKAPSFSETSIKFTGGRLQVIVKMTYI